VGVMAKMRDVAVSFCAGPTPQAQASSIGPSSVQFWLMRRESRLLQICTVQLRAVSRAPVHDAHWLFLRRAGFVRKPLVFTAATDTCVVAQGTVLLAEVTS
jgi:hypothetical protein